MASTPFRAIGWSPNELIGEDKMDQMASNMTWLRDNTPRGVYTLPSGLRRTEGLRIASGRVQIGARKTDQATVTVRFGNFFSARCQPIVTTGIVAAGQARIFCIVNGIGTLHPDHRGFQTMVNIDAVHDKNDKITNGIWINWQAMGY